MHILQPKHSKLSKAEVEALLKRLNISLSQLPKIKKDDATLPQGYEPGDVIIIERKEKDKEAKSIYYRVIV